MLVPVSWLKEYVDIVLPVEELAEKLTVAGLEVKGIEYVGIPGGRDKERLVWDREKLVIGQILAVNPHPNADRLVLATVEYGGDQTEVVVTGAPNLFPYLSQGDLSRRKLYSPFALEGAVLYDGHKEGQVKMALKGRELRGIYNRCMLCSEKELGLSDEHEGILILEGAYTPGTPVQDVLGDAILDIEIIPNIARCASMVGVAREVAALTGQKLREPDYHVVMDGPPIEGRVVITTDNPELNPRFVAMIIEGVEQRPSPQWMQRRLRLAGQRPINAVVDISNYVMLEMGQPNHTFDYDVLRRRADSYDPDGPIHIHTRLPYEGETLTTLDGVSHELRPYNILVTDPAGALSLGGIMGGLESEINDQTTNVLLEAAGWNFINIRRSANDLKISSEAGFRFSRGVHPSQAILGARRVAELLRRHAGGKVAQGIIDYYPNPPEVRPIRLTAAEVRRIGGINPSQAEIKRLLEALEFIVEDQGDHLLVVSPDHRLDIEGAHDLVEEVCRMYGYDRIPQTELRDTLPPQRNNEELQREEQIKDILVELELQEVITYRLTTTEREGRLLPEANSRPDDRPYVTLANPMTVDRVAMRHSLLASVLEIAAANSRFRERIAVYEIGPVYLAGEEGLLPDELRRLSILMTGPRRRPHWENGGAPETMGFFDLKGVIEELFAAIHVDGLAFEATQHPTYRPGRTARLTLDGRQIGLMGELHPLVLAGFDIRADSPVLAAELELEAILPHIPAWYHVSPVPVYPAVHEDIALVVDKSRPAAEVTAAIRRAGGPLLREVALFDSYEGGSIPAGKKSLAYHLTFQSLNKTLTDKEVRKNRERLVQQLERELGARLRDA
ncbi:MAG: phenylalanine--tRNA ligase subunit beta [Chloroflexi bacterium]|nr:phenylalanine--tRNA ligase subunit beta [Chloroflexota bacterium]MCI0574768.1 phenylalanine--tRNA ligase subunit beta [Chloroflexota bacterium]MCI0646407.1 phenylalanine--tRNA ligase subunit beta [Chloroflexota bacterium]MCI0725508.1 phenylalanine--tRNA ligase subunit beta [Chloroflexota bacterium]